MANHILVTGGAGFIGAHIVRRLVKEGHRVRVVDNLSTGSLQRLADVVSAIEFTEADLAEPSICDDVVAGIEFVIHQAAIPSVQRSIQDPVASNRSNITATLNLLESCRKCNVRRLIYAASSSAYGDTETLPKREDMPPNPLSPYALQKLVGERYCQLYHELYGLETVCLRYFNVFGPGQDPHSEYSAVIPKFISRILARQPLTVFGDGEQSRDFTYVENVVRGNLAALYARQAAGKVFNVAYGERTSLNTLIQILERILGVKAAIRYEMARKGDVRHSLADLRLARSVLGYEPKIGVEEGLKETVEAMGTMIGV
jgi:nucleoside-diphosphate-sugar epimerase